MVAAAREMTAAEFAAIDTPGRHDLVDGVLWSMPAAKFAHGDFAVRIIEALLPVKGDGKVVTAEAGYIVSRDRRTILCPDVSFVTRARFDPDYPSDFMEGAPDLAVEVISDSERGPQVKIKVSRYLAGGATLVWCVYPDLKQVAVFRKDATPQLLGIGDTLDAEPLLPAFRLPLAELFK